MSNGSTNYIFDVVDSQTFIVTWAEPAPTEYIVSYNDNGGSGTMIGDIVADGEEFTLEDCGYEAPDGQQFKGWAVGSVDATPLKQPGDKITITANTVIYAIWENIPAVVYTVSFNANGGTGTMNPVDNVSGSYTLPQCTFTAPAGKQFKGWALSANGSVIVGTTTNISTDTTLYAIWEDAQVNPDPDPEQGGSGENGNNNANNGGANSIDNAKKPLGGGAIAGIVIACVVVLAGAGVGVFFLLKKKGIIGKK